jgi:YfiH family protein
MLRFDEFEKLGLAIAAISEVSDGDCASTPGTLDARRAFCAACAVDANDVVCARQVHGTAVGRAEEQHRGHGVGFGKTDALITGVPGLPLAIFVADCVPVYLFDPRRRAGALIHAGREGTLQNIAGITIAALEREFGCRPADLHAVIGPSAGPCCYEVSGEIAATFRDARLPVRGRNLDLWNANALQIAATGTPDAQIHVTGICTICSGRFHSYRAGAVSKRNMALFML